MVGALGVAHLSKEVQVHEVWLSVGSAEGLGIAGREMPQMWRQSVLSLKILLATPCNKQ